MKKVAVLLFFLILCFSNFAYSADPFRVKSEKDFDEAIVKTRGTCEYSVESNIDRHPSFTNKTQHFFNSFFVEHSVENGVYKEKLIAPGHGVVCDYTLGQIFYEMLDAVKPETFSSKMVSVDILYRNDIISGGKVLKAIVDNQSGLDVGLLLFEINIPISSHKHIPIIFRNEVKKIVNIGDEVFVRGFMYPGDPAPDALRYKAGRVETINEHDMRVSTSAFPGMSGSPVVVKLTKRIFFVFPKKKFLVVGVLSKMHYTQYGITDVLWASLIPENFLD